MTTDESQMCGLNGCINPTDPDSPIGRCVDCTTVRLQEIMRLRAADAQRKAAVSRRAPVDAILVAQAVYRGDREALRRSSTTPTWCRWHSSWRVFSC